MAQALLPGLDPASQSYPPQLWTAAALGCALANSTLLGFALGLAKYQEPKTAFRNTSVPPHRGGKNLVLKINEAYSTLQDSTVPNMPADLPWAYLVALPLDDPAT